MSSQRQNYDAIIVGGGHNGLVAAFYLARSGLRTLVLERRDAPGGPCATVEYFPGHKSSITNSPGSLEQSIAADMGLERHGLSFLRTDPTLFTPFDEVSAFVGWRDQSKVRAQLDRFAMGDAQGFDGLLAFIDWFAAALNVSLFEPPPSLKSLVERINSPDLEEAFGKIFFGSIRDLAEDWLRSEQAKALIAVRGIVSIQAGPSTPGTAIPLLTRPLSLLSRRPQTPEDPRLLPLRGSTGFPKGGMGAIIDAMVASLRELGVGIRTKSAVRRIIIEDGRACGVELDGGEAIYAPIVVSNLNPKTTLLELLPAGAMPEPISARVRGLKMKGSAFKIAVSLDRYPRFRHAKNEEEASLYASCQFRIAPSMDYMDRAFEDANRGEPSGQPLMWGLCPTMIDPAMAPSGRHLLSVNVWHAPYSLRSGEWTSERREAFGMRCLRMLDDYMPGLIDSIVAHVFMSPADLEAEYGLLEANVIQGDHLPSRMFSLRPFAEASNYRAPVEGLYLCGAGTWPAGFVSGAPGHNAAQQVLRDVSSRHGDGLTSEEQVAWPSRQIQDG